jgi:hypothetical protein
MKEDLKNICRDLRRMVDSMPPGSMRDQMQTDLTCLRVRLMAMPTRVASHAPFDTAEEAQEVLEREVESAFSDVKRWMQPR